MDQLGRVGNADRRAYRGLKKEVRGAGCFFSLLHANEWQTFWNVTFPSIRTAMLGAGLLVFTLSLDEIAVSFFLIGRQNTLPLQIWGLLRRGITPEVNAASTVIFAVSMGVIVVWARLMREEAMA
jgi:spermidine/putrescine transport system permease protein